MKSPTVGHPMASAAAVFLVATSAAAESSKVLTGSWRASDGSDALSTGADWTGRSAVDGPTRAASPQVVSRSRVQSRACANQPSCETERDQGIVR